MEKVDLTLKKKFEEEVLTAYKECKKLNFKSPLFERMISVKGVYQTALDLIRNPDFSSGFSKLVYIHNRPDLTVEAVALRGPWKLLFHEALLNAARKKLSAVNYDAPEYEEPASEEFKSEDEEKKEWTDAELAASVAAYIEMLEHERAGEEYNKAEFNRSLREGILKNRTKASVELRMQNISAVLDELGLDWIEGYKPKANVGGLVKSKIQALLLQHEPVKKELKNISEPTPFEDQLNERVRRLSRTKIEKPEGASAPKKIETTSTAYYRDPIVKAWVLQNAAGICESCGNKAPFLTEEGTPYLEVHHVKPLADGGSDKIENAVALCPNCHRECHFSSKKNMTIEGLYKKISRLIKE